MWRIVGGIFFFMSPPPIFGIHVGGGDEDQNHHQQTQRGQRGRKHGQQPKSLSSASATLELGAGPCKTLPPKNGKGPITNQSQCKSYCETAEGLEDGSWKGVAGEGKCQCLVSENSWRDICIDSGYKSGAVRMVDDGLLLVRFWLMAGLVWNLCS